MPVMLALAPDGRQVAAQGRTCQQPKIEQIRLHAHECGNAAHHRQHRCHIRDVVNKCGEKHRSPYDERIDGKQVVSRDVDKQAADGVDDTRPRDARDDDEQARQQKQRLAVQLTEETAPAEPATDADPLCAGSPRPPAAHR